MIKKVLFKSVSKNIKNVLFNCVFNAVSNVGNINQNCDRIIRSMKENMETYATDSS